MEWVHTDFTRFFTRSHASVSLIRYLERGGRKGGLGPG